MTHLLPLADDPAPERADAARNREAILAAALRLVRTRGVDCVTMDTVASEAGVGKGTLFRRFESREGLMAAVLNESEAGWQASVISGPPPLGPGAPPLDRLLAFGHSRLRTNVTHGALIKAATGTSEVTRNIASVAGAVEKTGTAADDVLGSASELSRQSARLSAEVDHFLATVRAA